MLNTDLLSRSSVPITLLSSHSQSTILDTLSSTQSQSTSQSEDFQLPSQSSHFVTQPVSPSPTLRNTNREPDEANNALNSNHNDDQPETNRKIAIAGDSLLHRINSRKMMVNKIPSVYSLSPGVWQSFVTIRSCNHLMRIISTYVDNTKKSEIS